MRNRNRSARSARSARSGVVAVETAVVFSIFVIPFTIGAFTLADVILKKQSTLTVATIAQQSLCIECAGDDGYGAYPDDVALSVATGTADRLGVTVTIGPEEITATAESTLWNRITVTTVLPAYRPEPLPTEPAPEP